MNLDEFCDHCLTLPGVEAATPFGPEVLVYKVGGKLFALTDPDALPHRVNLKCDPERAMELRDAHEEAILPGYHMNKRHWNTLILGKLRPALVRELIAHSYELVVASLPKKVREQLAASGS